MPPENLKSEKTDPLRAYAQKNYNGNMHKIKGKTVK